MTAARRGSLSKRDDRRYTHGMKLPVPRRIHVAWLVAILVDAIQVGLFPLTGSLSTWIGAPLDLIAMGILWALLGWHWALAPSFIFELLPIAELAPTWTLATWIASRRHRTGLPEISGPAEPPGPAGPPV